MPKIAGLGRFGLCRNPSLTAMRQVLYVTPQHHLVPDYMLGGSGGLTPLLEVSNVVLVVQAQAALSLANLF